MRLLGRSVRMREVFGVLERIAATDLTVLIGGETGTGKDVIARGDPQGVAARARGRSSSSTAPRARRTSSSRSCSATSKARSPAPTPTATAPSSAPTAARCSSTRSASCRSTCSRKLLRALEQRRVKAVGGQQGDRTSTCASSPPPTATSSRRSKEGALPPGSLLPPVGGDGAGAGAAPSPRGLPVLVETLLVALGKPVGIVARDDEDPRALRLAGQRARAEERARRGVALKSEGGTLEPENLGLSRRRHGDAAEPPAADTYHEAKAQLIESVGKELRAPRSRRDQRQRLAGGAQVRPRPRVPASPHPQLSARRQ